MARNLTSCFSKIKYLSSPEYIPPENGSRHFSDPSPYSSLLFRNFNSLYENFNTAAGLSDSDGDDSTANTPDFATAFASQRFFFSSPGRSNSIIDSSSSSLASSSSSTSLNQTDAVSGGGVAVSTYSPDPFADFRLSMQEMVEAREIHDVAENWDALHQLLKCYLALNPRTTHKFIIGAFADLLLSLMSAPPQMGRRRTPRRDGKQKISR